MNARAIAVECLGKALARVYRPRDRRACWEWSEANIILDRRESIDRPGPYRARPYTRLFQEFFTSSEWDECIVVKSSQVGFTLAYLTAIAHRVATDPVNILLCLDSIPEMRRVSKARLLPMLKRCEATRSQISENEDDMQNLTYHLRDCTVYLLGAGSSGAMANKSVAIAGADELDEHPPAAAGDPESLDLLRDRVKSVEGGKVFAIGKPKTADAHQLWPEYLSGSQHRFYVPCPHCRHPQTLEWENARFDHARTGILTEDEWAEWDLEIARQLTWFECQNKEKRCRIEEKDKDWMVENGEWRQTNFRGKPRKLTMHISDLYSPSPKAKWGDLAVEYIEAFHIKDDPGLKRRFRQSRLGLPEERTLSEVTARDVMKLVGGYVRGSVPIEPVLVAAAADVQADGCFWVIGGFNKRGDLYIADYGETLSVDALESLRVENLVATPAGAQIPIRIAGIDSGHKAKKTDGVYQFCLKNRKVWYAMKGRGGVQIKDAMHKSHFQFGNKQGPLYLFRDDDFKRSLYQDRIGKHEENKATGRPALFLPAKVCREFLRQLSSESFTRKRDKYGYVEWGWHSTGPNHWGDAIKQLLVIWALVGHKFRGYPDEDEDDDTEGTPIRQQPAPKPVPAAAASSPSGGPNVRRYQLRRVPSLKNRQ